MWFSWVVSLLIETTEKVEKGEGFQNSSDISKLKIKEKLFGSTSKDKNREKSACSKLLLE